MLGYLFSTLSFDQSYLSNFAVQTRYQVDLALKQHQGGIFPLLFSLFLVSRLIGCFFYENESMYVTQVCVNYKIIYVLGPIFMCPFPYSL